MNRLWKVWRGILRIGARLTGRDPDDVDRWLLDRNNARTLARCRRHRPNSVLLLLPHCLQWTECPHRIVWHIDNCRACGKCTIKDLIELADGAGCTIRVALSSYTAPRIVRQVDPDLTVAIACERELTDGIAAVNGRLAYCIFNERPEGYCRNTMCNVDEVREVLTELLGCAVSPRPRRLDKTEQKNG